ncbi:hypothetical protein HHI36_002207 [Cryptolaemus montrouzieri]|uniref:Uncharacterized protein n=1 Tax=Cryptolaemus montrouzieri TaxID=559131 RepID=A0ABD2P9Y4_9CUCU
MKFFCIDSELDVIALMNEVKALRKVNENLRVLNISKEIVSEEDANTEKMEEENNDLDPQALLKVQQIKVKYPQSLLREVQSKNAILVENNDLLKERNKYLERKRDENKRFTKGKVHTIGMNSQSNTNTMRCSQDRYSSHGNVYGRSNVPSTDVPTGSQKVLESQEILPSRAWGQSQTNIKPENEVQNHCTQET